MLRCEFVLLCCAQVVLAAVHTGHDAPKCCHGATHPHTERCRAWLLQLRGGHESAAGVVSRLEGAIDNSDAKTVREIAEVQKEKLLHHVELDGSTALHRAAKKGRPEICDALLRFLDAHDARLLVDALDADCKTPLFHAVMQGHTETVRTLLRWGAHVNLQVFRGRQAQGSPVPMLFRGQIMALSVSQDANVAATHLDDLETESVLHVAVSRSPPNPDLVRLLLEEGADADVQMKLVRARDGRESAQKLLDTMLRALELAKLAGKCGEMLELEVQLQKEIVKMMASPPARAAPHLYVFLAPERGVLGGKPAAQGVGLFRGGQIFGSVRRFLFG